MNYIGNKIIEKCKEQLEVQFKKFIQDWEDKISPKNDQDTFGRGEMSTNIVMDDVSNTSNLKGKWIWINQENLDAFRRINNYMEKGWTNHDNDKFKWRRKN